MDTCNKISKYMQKSGYECRVMGVPKTIDNDLWGTDHCPGYGSAAKYIATSTMEVYRDARVYDKGMITVLEIMGRNAGWLTAAAALASYNGTGPDLIYLPEVAFDMDKFYERNGDIQKEQHVIIAVSEGIKDKDGKYISEYGSDLAKTKDSFGHSQLGGLASTLGEPYAAEDGRKGARHRVQPAAEMRRAYRLADGRQRSVPRGADGGPRGGRRQDGLYGRV